jgi:anaerobic dimethyl sulfoxide reductase subunit B (iron-sulfur subunit)
MAVYGLLIDYEYCTGCGSCEVSCKEEHGYPVGKWGIRILEEGPWEIEDGVFNWNKIRTNDLCDCARSARIGREPILYTIVMAIVIRLIR